MSDFTYNPPDSAIFMHTLRKYLRETGRENISDLLIGATVEFFTTGSYSGRHWDHFYSEIIFRVPVSQVRGFSSTVKGELLKASEDIFPPEVGYDLMNCSVTALLEAPPENEDTGLNVASLVSSGTIKHDGLNFRSRTETRIYDALKRKKVLFFANATAVLGEKNIKREPDFLVCKDGKWGILEVMGESYHPSTTAMRDHDRARLFKDYGLICIEFYDAERCYNHSDEVVDDFLERLMKT
jgi:hypothetical protein